MSTEGPEQHKGYDSTDTVPRVSVVVPLFNGERFIGEAIESVLAQTYSSWELIMVDDDSTDGSVAIAKGFNARHPERIRVIQHPGPRHRGTAASRNLGIANARGDFVANLDQDDVWHPTKLEEQVAVLMSHPSVAITFGPMTIWTSWGDRKPDRLQRLTFETPALFSPPDFLPLLLSGKNDPHGYLARKNAIESVGGYVEHVGSCEDWALYAKIALRHQIYVTAKSNYSYRQHPWQTCSRDRAVGQLYAGFQPFYDWMRQYLAQVGCTEPTIHRAFRRAVLRNSVNRLRETISSTGRRLLSAARGDAG